MTASMRSVLLVALLAAVGCSMTDAATRLASDINHQAAEFAKSPDTERTFAHVPVASPSGCPGAYQVTVEANGALVIGCDKAYPQVSFTTTSHRAAVTVPAQLQVNKNAGETLSLTLRKQGSVIELAKLQ